MVVVSWTMPTAAG